MEVKVTREEYKRDREEGNGRKNVIRETTNNYRIQNQ